MTVTSPAVPMIIPTYRIYNFHLRQRVRPAQKQLIRNISRIGTVAGASSELSAGMRFIIRRATFSFEHKILLASIAGRITILRQYQPTLQAVCKLLCSFRWEHLNGNCMVPHAPICAMSHRHIAFDA